MKSANAEELRKYVEQCHKTIGLLNEAIGHFVKKSEADDIVCFCLGIDSLELLGSHGLTDAEITALASDSKIEYHKLVAMAEKDASDSQTPPNAETAIPQIGDVSSNAETEGGADKGNN